MLPGGKFPNLGLSELHGVRFIKYSLEDTINLINMVLMEDLPIIYRDEIYSLQILLSRTQAGPGRTVKQEQEEISPNHVQRINLISIGIVG